MAEAKIVLSAEDRTRAAFASARQGLGEVSALAARAGFSLAALGSAVTLGGLASMVRQVANNVDQFNDLKDATGASIENISALEGVARRTGGNFDLVSTSLIKFNQALGATLKPGSDAEKVIKAIGLNAKELRDMDPAEALRETAVALSGFADDGAKARAVQELFGRSLREVAPYLKDLAEAGQLNATVTTQQAEEAEKFNKELSRLSANAEDAARAIANPLITGMNQLIERFKLGQEEGDNFLTTLYKIGGINLNPADQAVRLMRNLLPGGNAPGNGYTDARTQVESIDALLRNDPSLASGERQALIARRERAQQQLAGYLNSTAGAGRGMGGYEGLAKGSIDLPADPDKGDTAKKKAAAAALNRELEAQAQILAELSGRSRTFAEDWNRLNVMFAAGKLNTEQLAQAQEALIAKQPAVQEAMRVAQERQKARNEEYAQAAATLTAWNAAADEQVVAARTMLEQLQFETQLLGLSNEEREVAIALRELENQGIKEGTAAYEKYGVAIREAVIQKAAVEEHARIWESIDKTAHDTFVNIFESGASAFKRLGQTLKAALLDLLYQMTIKKWIINISANLTGNGGGIASMLGGGQGGGMGSLMNGASMYNSISNGASTVGGWLGIGGGAAAASAGGIGLSATAGSGMALAAPSAGLGLSAGAGSGLSLASAGGGLGMTAGSAGAGTIGAGIGGGAAAGGGIGAGAAGAASAIPVIGAIIAMIALIAGTMKGETRHGGKYTGTKFIEGPSGGQINGEASSAAMGATEQGINEMFRTMGSETRVKELQGGFESSRRQKGFAYAGVELTDGTVVGQRHDSGYMNRRGNKSQEQAAKEFGEELKQVTIQALQESDVPFHLGEYVQQLGDIDKLNGEALDAAYNRITKAFGERSAMLARLDDMNTSSLDKLKKARDAERASIDETNKLLLEVVYATEDMYAARDQVLQAYSQEAATLQSLALAHRDFARELREFRDGLLLGDRSGLSLGQQRSEAERQYARALTGARAGDVDARRLLPAAADKMLEVAMASSSSAVEYNIRFAQIASDLTLAAADADGKATIAEQQLNAMTAAVGALGLLNTTVMSFAQAFAAYTGTQATLQAAQQAEAKALAEAAIANDKAKAEREATAAREAADAAFGAQAWEDFLAQNGVESKYWVFYYTEADKQKVIDEALAKRDGKAPAPAPTGDSSLPFDHIGQYASGGTHLGGLRLVGERGPELEVTGPARIFSATQTRDMLRGGGGNSSEVVAELRNVQLAQARQHSALEAIAQRCFETAKDLREIKLRGLQVRNTEDQIPLTVTVAA